MSDQSTTEVSSQATDLHFKDEILDRLADRANVAQFVSFAPGATPSQRFVRIHGYPREHVFENVLAAITCVLENSPEKSVNIRSFDPVNPKSREFIYGIHKVDRAVSEVERLGRAGLHTIVNETIDVDDGGVSGVLQGGVIEFAPGDTPRCVEKPGTLSLSENLARQLIETVYSFSLAADYGSDQRVEFSVHPIRRGVRHEHTIIWELETVAANQFDAGLHWPNRFSRFIGDKAFGLLLADLIGLPVPRTTVIARRLAPFTFGRTTDTGEYWVRTCPTEQVPGKFTTQHGWIDPFELMQREDPDGQKLASVLAQEGVGPVFSGALVVDANGNPLIEGVRGAGEDFMQGTAAPESLPDEVNASVSDLYKRAFDQLGAVRMEWVYDGNTTWVVQLHQGVSASYGRTVFPGSPDKFHRFEVGEGLEALRELISQVQKSGDGIVLVGRIGLTSHMGDVLRRAQVPSRIAAAVTE